MKKIIKVGRVVIKKSPVERKNITQRGDKWRQTLGAWGGGEGMKTDERVSIFVLSILKKNSLYIKKILS